MSTTTSHTGTQLLAAAYDEPQDPTVATIYADWLDENDRPEQAELVRLQADSDLWWSPRSDPGRQRQLIPSVRQRLWAELPDLSGIDYEFRFGLPVAVARNLSAYRRYASTLSEAGVRWLRLCRRGGLEAVDDCTPLAGLRYLDLTGLPMTPGEVRALVDCPHLTGLRGLSLCFTRIGFKQMLRVCESATLKNLRTLDLSGTHLGSGTSIAIDYARQLPVLEVLGVGLNECDVLSTRLLTTELDRGTLTQLGLSGNPIGDIGVGLLTRCEGLARLRRLDLGYCMITTEGAITLAECPYLAGIDRVNVAGNPIGTRGGQLLKGRFGGRVSVD